MYECSGPEYSKLRQIFAMLRLRMRPVTPDKYHLTLAELADGKGDPLEDASDVKPVPERMLVFCGLNQVLLAQVLEVIRLAKLPPIPMKAVLTMNNLQWNTMHLYEELCREREAVQAQQNGQAPAEAGGEENAEAEAPKTEETKPEEPTTEEKPEEKADPIQDVKQRLAEYRSDTPAFALEAATHEVLAMGAVCLDNVQTAIHALQTSDEEAIKVVLKKEEEIDQLETILTEYMVKLNNLSLNDSQSMQLRNLLYTINDLERIGDHAENLAELAQTRIRNGLEFSPMALKELKVMGDSVMEALEHAFLARAQFRMCNVETVEELEEKVDAYEEQFRAEHITASTICL